MDNVSSTASGWNASDNDATVVTTPCATSTDVSTLEMSVVAAVLAVVCIASVVANVMVFVVFFKKTSLLTISNRFIVNLTVCNSLNTFFVMPFVFVSLVTKTWVFGSVWCQATGFFMNVVFGASTLTLVVVSFDRYCAVVTPLHYKLRITSKRCSAMISCVWTVAVVSSLPPLIGWNHIEFQSNKMVCTVKWSNESTIDRYYTLFLVSLFFVLPLIAMLWAYFVIFRAARMNSERTRRSSVVPSASGEDLLQSSAPIGRRRSSTIPILIRRISISSRSGSLLMSKEDWKAAVTSFLVLFSFIFCWLPYFIVIVVESVLPVTSPLSSGIGTFSIVMAMLSCACNPLVYVFRSTIVRQELKVILLSSRTKVQLVTINREDDTRRPSADINSSNQENAKNILPISHTPSTLTSVVSVQSHLSDEQ